MPIVKFSFDKNKDLWNNWQICNNKSKWKDFSKNASKELIDITKEKTFEQCKNKIEEYLFPIHNSEIIQIFIDSLTKTWEKIEEEYFKRLTNITKKPIPYKNIICYVTTVGRCPYNEKEGWFMVNFFSSIPSALQTIGHEIMHLQFHKYFWENIEKQIGKEKTADLKEALTVLLNLEFRDLWFVEDKGYKPHKELRDFISKEWKKEKNFENLLKKSINYIIQLKGGKIK